MSNQSSRSTETITNQESNSIIETKYKTRNNTFTIPVYDKSFL
jgi:hypothetical protein